MHLVLKKLYKTYHVSPKDESHFRNMIYEYIQLLDKDHDKEIINTRDDLNSRISLLEKDFKTQHTKIESHAISRQEHDLNSIHNKITRLKSLQKKQDQLHKLLNDLCQNNEFRKKIKDEIEGIDYKKPSLWSIFVDNLLFMLGGRPK